MVDELSHEEARRRLPENSLGFGDTSELAPLEGIIGQDRGVRALRFGLEMKGHGFNVYLAGQPGTGRRRAIVSFLKDMAETMPVPPDWCYVNNFEEPRRPKALKLPAGKGAEFQKNMRWFVSEVKEALTKAFESEEYAGMLKSTLEEIEEETHEVNKRMIRVAREAGFLLQRSPVGLGVIPIVDGRQISEEELAQLPPDIRGTIQRNREVLQDELRRALRQLGKLEKKADAAVEEVNRRVAAFAMEHIFQMMGELYRDISEVKAFLEEVREDVLDNLPVLLGDDEAQELMETLMNGYRVNLVVDNSALEGAPVVTEPHPTHRHIFGYMEREVRFGTMTTDFTLIRGGSAHRANGGFLIIPVEDLFNDPHLWNSLKRAIRNERLEIGDIPEPMEFMTTRILMPEPIPFDAKVILVGSPQL
ncbi:MAG: AAA family ATPase, partial [Candidatus Bathyarchaeia archaeon]